MQPITARRYCDSRRKGKQHQYTQRADGLYLLVLFTCLLRQQ